MERSPFHLGIALLLWGTVRFLAIECSLTFSLPLLLLYLQEETILAFRARECSIKESGLHSPPTLQPKSEKGVIGFCLFVCLNKTDAVIRLNTKVDLDTWFR